MDRQHYSYYRRNNKKTRGSGIRRYYMRFDLDRLRRMYKKVALELISLVQYDPESGCRDTVTHCPRRDKLLKHEAAIAYVAARKRKGN